MLCPAAPVLPRFTVVGRRREAVRVAGRRALVQLARGAQASARRVLDGAASLVLLALGAPLAAVLLAAGGGRPRLTASARLGRHGRVFCEYGLQRPPGRAGAALAALRLQRLPALLNVLRGEMSLVGPRAAGPQELSLKDRRARRRLDVAPGLVCLWWIRRRTNIAYGEELDADWEYLESRGLATDSGIALRAVTAALYGESPAAVSGRLRILGIPVDNLSMQQALDAIAGRLSAHDGPAWQVCFVNADCANLACRDAVYAGVLEGSQLRLADGIGLKLAGRILGRPVRENVNGTDLFPRLCRALEGTAARLFLLGGRPGVAEGVRDWLGRHHPRLAVVGCCQGYFPQGEGADVARRIAATGADLLLVALGAPHQERWIRRHLPATGAKVAIGVGGLFDFYAGRIARAPLWVREIGLEWVYRLWREPRRMWRRYLVGNGVFLARVLAERLCGEGRTSVPGNGTSHRDTEAALHRGGTP